jgi:Calcium binding
MENRNLAIGHSVVVKPGVTDPDTGNDISGWQGRIHAFYDDEETLAILWDSLTLKNLSPEHIAWCEEEGLSWTEMNLSTDEVEPVAARDTEKDVAATIKEIQSQSNWLYLGGEQGKRIQQIVNRAGSGDESDVFRSWHAYLEEHLVFPFAAVVGEDSSGPIRPGERVTVVGIVSLDEPYGTIVSVKHRLDVYQFPLCDLEVTVANDETREVVGDYEVWLGNR